MKRFLPIALGLLAVIALPACDISGGEDATVTGVVTNTFSQPLQGGTVDFDGECSATTTSTGSFSCVVVTGSVDVIVSVPGYTTKTFSVNIDGDGPITVPPLSGLGNIDAQIVNSVSGDALVSAGVECARVLPSGDITATEFSGTTSATGQLVASGLFTGEASCQIAAGSEVIPLQVTITETTTGTIGATPRPPSGTYRIVLSWGENPRDLDSHLTGPDGSGGRFHVYYSNREAGTTNLDLDDTSSFGPETTTLVPTGNGMYRFSVHNYSTQDATGAAGIAASPATVRVYNSSGLLRTYFSPATTAANGGTAANTWKVFEMTISGSSATFTGAAPAGIGYVTAASSGDAATFLTGGGVFADLKAIAL